MQQRFFKIASIAVFAVVASTGAWAQQPASPEAMQQMSSISSVKANFTRAQKKMDSNLAFGILAATNDPRVASFRNAIAPLGGTDTTVAPNANSSSSSAPSSVTVEITGIVSPALASAIIAANGVVVEQSERWGVVTASLPIAAVAWIADRDDVSAIRIPSAPHTNAGAVTSQGYITHEANKVVNNLGINGTGVTVGVLSDSASAARIATLIGSGDLPANTTVLAGQAGSGSDEGTAMMEIIHDMAPGASLIFATAFTSEVSFANNIIALAAAGCKVIVDDITYFDEGAFQDGIVAQAVNQVTAAGVVYFSSAANSGSLTFNTSGTWEGDFVNGGPVTAPITATDATGSVHNFGTVASPQNYDVLTASTRIVTLKWSDPLNASNNDYDLFVLNSTGTTVLGFSAAAQTGTQSPYEIAFLNAGFPVGSRIVVVQFSGAARALHLDTNRGRLSIATTGSTFGHNAGLNTMSTAATYWNSAHIGTRPFTGFANPDETFSSDGPRKIFYNPNGSAITPGNFLFGTNGGTTLQKPDIAAADGVSTRTPGFLPFFGTSAAAPHAAAIAALVRAARPDYTVAQVKTAIIASALDSMAVGPDRDSGFGIAMALAAVQYALTH